MANKDVRQLFFFSKLEVVLELSNTYYEFFSVYSMFEKKNENAVLLSEPSITVDATFMAAHTQEDRFVPNIV